MAVASVFTERRGPPSLPALSRRFQRQGWRLNLEEIVELDRCMSQFETAWLIIADFH